jgi:TonB-dependent receptor
MYNRFTDDENRRRKIYTLDDAVTETLYLYGGIEHDVKNRIKIQTLSSINLGGENEISPKGIILDYEAAYSVAAESEPNRLESTFENPGQAITMKIDRSDPEWPKVIFTNPENAQNAYDYENYDLDELLFRTRDISDQNVTGKFNFTIPYLNNSDNFGIVKFGAKVRFKEKEADTEAKSYGAYKLNQYYPDYGDTLNLVNVQDGINTEDFFGQGYVINYIPGADNMREFYDFNAAHFVYGSKGYTESRIKSNDNDYLAHENVYAAYAMVQHDFKKLMVLGGVRYERTDVDYKANRIILTNNGWYDTMNVLEDTRVREFILPQAQIKYSFNENLNLRAAVTYSYSRPNFEDVIPFRYEERDDVKYGNPDLEYPTSLNVDLLFEQYLVNSGIIALGAFYKKIDNFIFNYTRYAHEGDPENWSLKKIETPMNGIESFVYGLEAQTQFKTLFLPGFAQNFGLYLNYTFTYSEAYIYQRYPANFSTDIIEPGQDPEEVFYNRDEQEQITLPGQAKHTVNVALFYDSPKVYAKISANYHDSFLYSLGGDSDLDEYYGEAFHLDFNANYNINENLTVFTEFINLTNAPLEFYLGKPENGWVKKKEFYSWTGRLGIRFTF